MAPSRHFSSRVCAVAFLVALGALTASCSPKRATPKDLHSRELDKAREQIAAGQTVKAEATLKDLLSSDPGSAPAYAELGNLYLLHRSFPRAIQALETAAALDPSLPFVFARLAQAYLEIRWYQEAREAVVEAVRREPENAYAHSVQGELALRDDDMTSALSAFRRVLELDPESELASVKVGFILLKLQRAEEAETVLREALKKHPHSPALQLQLAETYFLRPQLPQSADLAEKHYQLSLPNNPSPDAVHARLGELAMRRNDAVVARRHWSQCLELEPGNATALNGMAQIELRESNAAAHRQLVKRLTERRAAEKRYSALSARARADKVTGIPALRAAQYAAKHGMMSDAERRITDAIRAAPELRAARELRAEIYAQQGRRSEARNELRIASGLRPD